MSRNQESRSTIRRQIKLPNREALKIALRSIKIRFWRSMITISGIVLTIAFLTYVILSGYINAAIPFEKGELAVTAAQDNTRQYWLIGISLLVCFVGITNAMLMSVTERYREIGTMKCLGALDWFVIKLFLIEALFQGLIGSILGAILGALASIFVSFVEHGGTVFALLPWGQIFSGILGAILVGGVIAVLGAVYPARRAGKMPPADAMRTEI
ncbi:MAG TPA: FtsX-like permease family protein [Candidatus Hydrogenedentes bacterium]|nr:FtsX-like permease family protein [Candidatus Hydrogenedentota bacterium]HOL75586.1 FtsX-like permease family protein [Candidatus Hydrogenedentota bacterium]HPO86990.1 FtsX-like permease family protein [Candidatus Hydrogenedentota bacterium]